MRTLLSLVAALLLVTLAGCGGGGGPAACKEGVPTMLFPNGCDGDPLGGQLGQPTLALTLTDAAGAAVSTVTPESAGSLRVALKDAKGNPAAQVAVSFLSTDGTGGLLPASGTALTDAGGLARVGLPAGSQAGAFTATASATVDGVPVSARIDYAVSFPVLSFGPLAIAPATVSAGGTASLSVTVLDGADPYAPAQSVSFTSPCAASGKAEISSPVTTVNGVASTSYTDKGCGAADLVTAATTLAGATATQTATLSVLPATAGQVIFVSALPQNIALKGTGGPGRQESSTVTFRVLDRSGNAVAGVPVDFFVFSNTGGTAGTGGLTLSPTTATSGADGSVSTVVLAGIVNTPVRISATVGGTSPAVTSISDQLVVSTGIPDQNSFSLSTEIFNTEGWNHDGCPAPVGSRVTVFMADHFNNPVPDGTAVSFTAEGGQIGASCLTGLVDTQLTDGTVITQKGKPGYCSVDFCATQPRPADGRVTIMAYALGEESFVDDPAIPHSINRYDPGEAFEDLCEPFRSDRAIRNSDANPTLMDTGPAGAACPSPVAGEPYIDTNANGLHDTRGDGRYNGVLNIDPTTGKTVANGTTPTVHVRASLVQVMSTSAAAITPLGAVPLVLDRCTDGTRFVNVAKVLPIAIRDLNPTVFPGNTLPGNILPVGTTIAFTASNGTILSEANVIVPNTNEPLSAAWTYYVTMQSDAAQTGPGTTDSSGVTTPGFVCSNAVSSGLLTVKVTTPLGLVTTRSFSVTD